jgi:hypothetical protein
MPDPAPWNPSKGTRILIGVLTVWPPIYLVLFVCTIGLGFFLMDHASHRASDIDLFKYIFPLHCMTMLLTFALTAVYIVHAFRNDRLPSDRRILWVIVLFMGNMFAFPVYWWIYLRPGAPTT